MEERVGAYGNSGSGETLERHWALRVAPQSFPFSGSQAIDFGVLQNVIAPPIVITWSY